MNRSEVGFRKISFTWRAAGLFVLSLVTALGCERATRSPSEGTSSAPAPSTAHVVARVEGEPIAVEDLRMVGIPGLPARREQLLQAAITRRLAAEEARRRGLDKSKDVQARIEAVRREARANEEAVLRDALFQSVRDGLQISEADLRDYYEKTKSLYFERQVKLRQQAFPSKVESEATIARLGPEGHLDPAKSETIGPALIQDLPKAVLPEAFRLRKPGDRIIVTREGRFSIVELEEVLPAVQRPLEAVRDRVEKSLRTLRASEAYRALLEKRRAEAKIEINQKVLADDSLWKENDGALRQRRMFGRSIR